MKRIPAARIRAVWMDPELSTYEAAELVGLTRANLWHRARALGLPARKVGRRWRIGAAQEAEFRDMWLRGLLIADMARHFGVSEPSIVYRRRSLGLPGRGNNMRHFAAGREAEFAAMWAAGIASDAIAAHFGAGSRTVVERARLMGLPRRARGGVGLPIEAWHEMRVAAQMAVAAQRERQAMRERMAA